MEIGIGLLILIVLWEMRERRNDRERDVLVKELGQLRASQVVASTAIIERANRLLGKVQAQGKMYEAQAMELAELKIAFIQNNEKIAENGKFIDSCDQAMKTIIKEYEINGVPLGYARKPRGLRPAEEANPDYVTM